MLTVPDAQAKSHSAKVVRCSSCGGPRHGQEPDCAYCGASFTLIEKDLHVICPTCFTRISSHAKFCHSCATPIVVEQELGEESELRCPVCEGGAEGPPRLVSRSLGPSQAAVLECPSCLGIWISHGLFERAVRHNQQQGFTAATGAVRPTSSKVHAVKMRKQQGPMYRKCPECSTVMNRQNYARRSGIIIDLCPQHGIWFDAEELEAILEWLRDGGDSDRIQRHTNDAPAVPPDSGFSKPNLVDSSHGMGRSMVDGADVVDLVSDLLFQLFR
ncbi:MAG: zf-TFIIB domain-containing protein [Myxococcota bacterium]